MHRRERAALAKRLDECEHVIQLLRNRVEELSPGDPLLHATAMTDSLKHPMEGMSRSSVAFSHTVPENACPISPLNLKSNIT